MAKPLTKDKRISEENKRLRAIYADLPENIMKLYDGLIYRAAYMRVTLEEYEQDMNERGYVEQFSQSDKLDPYERGRPVVGFYNTMNKNYQSIMKQLAEKLPEAVPADVSDEIMRFAVGGEK